MEGSASTPPSSATAASASAPATPASVEQLDKGQVSGLLGRGGSEAGWPWACEARGAGAGSAPPEAPPGVLGRSLGRAALSFPAPSCARGGACRPPPPVLRPAPPPQVDCRCSLGFRGELHLALLAYWLTWAGRLILQASVTSGLKGRLLASAPPRDQRRQGPSSAVASGLAQSKRSVNADCGVLRFSRDCCLNHPGPGKHVPTWRGAFTWDRLASVDAC